MEELIEKYIGSGFLKREKSGDDQIEKFLKSSRREVKAAEANLCIDLENSYECSYGAMFKAGRALLFFYGLRPDDGAQHRTVVEISSYFLGEKYQDLIMFFNQTRKKRNTLNYDEPDLIVSPDEAREAVMRAKEFLGVVHDHLLEKRGQRKLL